MDREFEEEQTLLSKNKEWSEKLMREQKKNEAGITLVALVVSIIVMLVLAGVSLNATIGDNGIVTRAQEAAIQTKIAQQKEAIEHALTSINIDTLSEDSMPEIEQIARKLVSVGAIDDYQRAKDADGNPTENVAVIIDPTTRNRCFFGIKEDNKYKISRDAEGLVSAELVSEISGGNVEGLALVTKESFGEEDTTGNDPNKGKFEITSDAEVMFLDPISGKLSIYVPSGVHAKVSIYAKMELTNAGIKRSAIDIAEGGELDLYVDDGVEVAVNSGIGEGASGGIPGKGGYAGIHVSWDDKNNNNVIDDGDEYAVLNLKGNGTIVALGGKAGDGGTYVPNTVGDGGAGGGGAGAGIGGNGGNGGKYAVGRGTSGTPGENCGIVNIHDMITVYAYGGAGGSGGAGSSAASTAGGGGGYPGAGIGGGGAGGAGGTCCAGGGGYTGGTGDTDNRKCFNGLSGEFGYIGTEQYLGGGGYFQGALGIPENDTTLDKRKLSFGGAYNQGSKTSRDGQGHASGSGGYGGKGGTISASKDSNVYAFNGNLYTDGTNYQNGLYQCPIYSQIGISVAKYDCRCLQQNTRRFSMVIEEEQSNIDISKIKYLNKKYDQSSTLKDETFVSKRYLNINTLLEINDNSIFTNVDMAKQGVGSGAGYIEVSNGSYEIYKEDSNGNFTTVYTGV